MVADENCFCNQQFKVESMIQNIMWLCHELWLQRFSFSDLGKVWVGSWPLLPSHGQMNGSS